MTVPGLDQSSLEEVRWEAELSIRAFGVALHFRTNKKELLASLVAHLPPGWTPSRAKPRAIFSLLRLSQDEDRFQLFLNKKRLARSRDLKRLLIDFESDVQLFVAEMSPRRVFVHAGVIGWYGQAVMIPGRSFSGKSTLVRELVREGASYYSDEYAVIDERGRVHPYARPLAMRTRGGTIRVQPGSLGVQIGEKPLPVGLILICRYREDGRWRPRKLSDGAGALEVLNNTVPARRRPQKVVEVIGQVVSGALIVKTARGDVKETARKVLDLLKPVQS